MYPSSSSVWIDEMGGSRMSDAENTGEIVPVTSVDVVRSPMWLDVVEITVTRCVETTVT
jgi:hypothetical protein